MGPGRWRRRSSRAGTALGYAFAVAGILLALAVFGISPADVARSMLSFWGASLVGGIALVLLLDYRSGPRR